jgi:hypothetical protein
VVVLFKLFAKTEKITMEDYRFLVLPYLSNDITHNINSIFNVCCRNFANRKIERESEVQQPPIKTLHPAELILKLQELITTF